MTTSYRPVPLLSGGVPDLHFHLFPIHCDTLGVELHSDGGFDAKEGGLSTLRVGVARVL